MRRLKDIKSNKKVVTSLAVVMLVLLAIVLRRSFAVLTPVKSITISSEKISYENKEPGSWQVKKSAKWIDKGKARITFDIDTVMKPNAEYRDVILVLDISESMEGDKLKRVKEDTSKLIESLLANDKNRVALITFEATSEIVDNLTNNKEKLINDINNLTVATTTNYYQALVNVENILKEYQKEPDRDAIVLFLTDGYPNVDTPNEIGQYSYLKKAYPYLVINGVQYEMGTDLLSPIKKVTDNQYVTDMKSLNNVLFDASANNLAYKSFNITDYIDDTYFNVKNINSIQTTIGTANIEYENNTPKVEWTIEEGKLKSGERATMTIDIELKDEYLGQGGVYPTNRKEEITSSLENVPDENITSNKTPIISDKYMVKYEINAPTACEIPDIPNDESYFVFDTVAKSDIKPTCGTYQFKGWEIVNKDITMVNDDYFIMPEEDVIIRATWSKLAINKSMNGEVSKVQTLYKVMADDAVPDNIKSEFVTSDTGINFAGTSSDTNGKGVYQLSSTKDDEFPVYYYRGDVNNNNVKFAGFCWKAVRTTSTGGVKLIYNGLPDEEGKCTNTTGTSTQIGTSGFNSSMYGSEHSGYMYGTVYKETYKTLPKWYELINKKAENSNLYKQNIILTGTKEYYSDSVIWDGSNYVLTNKDGSEVVQIEWNNESYSTFKGKYRCLDGNQTTCTEVYYVAGTGTKASYTLSLTNGQLLKDVNTELNLGKGVIYADGKYTLEEITTINKLDWFDNYKMYNNYYMCQDGSISCTEITYIVDGRSEYITNVVINNGETYESLNEQAKNIKWLYGNDVSWDGTNYTLINTTESSPVEWESERNKIGNGYHYTCFSTENSCSIINYIYYSITPTYYVILNNGTTIDKALEEMQVNETNSLIKTEVDKWYRDNMMEYTPYLEDTVWCNDRSMGNSNGWTKDGDASNFLEYGPSSRARKPDISCKNKNDSFTVSEENGNGALIYPVALLTSDEIALAGGKPTSNNREYYLYTNQSWWLMSPSKFVSTHLFGTHVNEFGNIVANYINSNVGIRPAISIKVDTKILGGNGTATDPYTLDLEIATP